MHFDANILPDLISVLVKQKKRQQTAHPSVSVIERMNAQKIMDEYRYYQKRINLVSFRHFFVLLTYCINARFCFKRFCRHESNELRSICMCFLDIILSYLILPSKTRIRILHQIPMELKYNVSCNRDESMPFMNCIQDITVSCYLFLASAFWKSLLFYNLSKTRTGSNNSLYSVRRFYRLHLCYFDKTLQLNGFLPRKQLLPPLALMNEDKIIQDLIIPFKRFIFVVIKAPHFLIILFIPKIIQFLGIFKNHIAIVKGRPIFSHEDFKST